MDKTRSKDNLKHLSSFCRVHRDVTYGGPGVSLCEQFVFLPTAMNALWLSVETGFIINNQWSAKDKIYMSVGVMKD